MSFNFVIPEMQLNGTGTPTLQFYRKGFELGGSGSSPEWRDIILKGNTALTLVNAKEDSLSYLKLFGGTEQLPETYLDTVTLSGGCEQRNLPSGYTEYDGLIESDGLAYINLNCSLTQDDEIELEFTKTSNIVSKDIFGGRISASSNNISVILAGSGNVVEDFNNSDYTDYRLNTAISLGTRYKVVMNKTGRYLYQGDTLIASNTTACPDTITTVGCYLFSLAGTGLGSKFQGTIHRCLIKGKRDVVPCGNGTAYGMYDKLNGVFYPNANTEGGFTVGNEIVPTPSVPIDIVCNNGVIKFGKPITIDNTRNYAYINTTGSWVWSSDSYSIALPVTVGGKYRIIISSTDSSIVGTIFRYGFTDSDPEEFKQSEVTPSPTSISIYDFWRGAPQDLSDVEVTATHPYMIIQFAAAYASTVVSTYLTVIDQSIYTDGTTETVTDSNGLTASAERLLAVGTYKDTQEVLSGSVTRNVGIKVLDGTEEWTQTDGYSNPYVFHTIFSDGKTGSGTLERVWCTHFQGVAETNPNMPPESAKITVQGTTPNISRFYTKTSVASTVALFKQFLADQYNAGTPVIVVYPLATATTESVTGQFLSKSPVTQTAGSISNLPIAITESSHTVPTPQQPLDINCNNGVVKARHQSGLPLGYTQLDYIESDGTQYIDIDVSGNATFIGTAQSTTDSPTASQVLVANGGASAGRWFGVQSPSVGEPYSKRWGLGATATASTTIYGTTKVDFNMTFSDVDGQYGTVNNETLTRTTTIPTQGDWIAFAGATSPLYGFIGKVWKLQAVQNNVLVRDFVPCKNSLNIAGMYDLVSGRFFGSSTASNFVAGNPVSDAVEIYVDGTTETVWVHSKNLFNASAETLNKFINDSGAIVPNNNYAYSDFITVNPGETYTASLIKKEGAPSGTLRIHGYDASQNWVQLLYGLAGSQLGTVTIPSDIKYVRISWWKSDYADDRQFEQGSTATTYVPYYNGGSATAENLLKVGTYQDVQSVLDGEVTRKVGIKVLDGTENWSSYQGGICWTSANLLPSKVSGNAQSYCTHYSWTSSSTSSMTNNQFLLAGTARICIKDDRFQTDTAFKQWLAQQYANGTPVIVIYPLATPTTETVESQALTIQAGTNIVEITQASMDNLELEVSYKGTV